MLFSVNLFLNYFKKSCKLVKHRILNLTNSVHPLKYDLWKILVKCSIV